MAFLRRDHPQRPPTGSPAAAAPDSPAALRARLEGLVTTLHANSGRLPVEAVVAGLAVLDTLGEVVVEAEQGDLDMRALVTLEGLLDDYVPTTFRSYLALDPSVTEVRRPSGHTPRESLLEQVEALATAADELLLAARSRDADALLAQGRFLRTKFTGSDLDL